MATSALIGEKELPMNLYMWAMTSFGFCAGRDGGAMNSGPAGSLIDSRTISSMAFKAARSSFQPPTSAIGLSWLG